LVRVKICGLTRQSDAEFALECGADAVGFVFEPSSPRYIGGNEEALAVPHRLAPYAQCVAVYGNYQSGWSGYTGCNVIQYADGDPWPNPLPYVLACRIGQMDEIDPFVGAVNSKVGEHEGVKGILLDAFDAHQFGGTGKTIDWSFAAEVVNRVSVPVILAGGLTPENVADAVRQVRPYAVDVSSGVESEPGLKDLSKVREFIMAAKGATR